MKSFKVMADFFYNNEEQELFLYSNLKSYKLNETAAYFFDQYSKNISISDIAKVFAEEYDISVAVAENDISILIDELRQLGIDIKTHSGKESDQSQKNEFDKVAERFHPHTPIVHIIQNCNSPCKMCDCWKTEKKVWHSAAKLKPYFQKMKQLGTVTIMVSGGEPLLHPELPQILSDLKEIGLSIMLNTNGLLLHKHAWLTELEIDSLVVSMDGHNPEIYKMYRGLNGYNIVWNNMELFQKKSPKTKIGIRTIINKYNYDKVDLLLDEIESRGMHSVGFSPADVNSTSFSREMDQQRLEQLTSLLLPSEIQIENFLQNFVPEHTYYKKIELAAEKGISTWQPYDFISCMLFYLNVLKGNTEMFSNTPCFFPYSSMVLDYNGDLKNCFYSKAFGNLYDFDNVDWNFQSSMNELHKSNQCQSCRGKVFCGSKLPNGTKQIYGKF